MRGHPQWAERETPPQAEAVDGASGTSGQTHAIEGSRAQGAVGRQEHRHGEQAYRVRLGPPDVDARFHAAPAENGSGNAPFSVDGLLLAASS
jgi:hypothetical protein